MKEIDDLRFQIIKCCYWYYVKAQPLIPDQEFDQLFKKLQALEAVYGTTPDSPTQMIYGDLESQYQKILGLEDVLVVKSKFNTAKIVIEWYCNLDCSYCCNKDPEVRKTFKPITQREIEKTDYQDYELTGGEIIIPQYFSILCTLCTQNIPKDRNIYVYSNGTYLSDPKYAQIMKGWGVKGLNIGYHGIPLAWWSLQEINKFLPIRLWVRKDEMTDFLGSLGFEIKLWELGDCDKITTDRFYLNLKK